MQELESMLILEKLSSTGVTGEFEGLKTDTKVALFLLKTLHLFVVVVILYCVSCLIHQLFVIAVLHSVCEFWGRPVKRGYVYFGSLVFVWMSISNINSVSKKSLTAPLTLC